MGKDSSAQEQVAINKRVLSKGMIGTVTWQTLQSQFLDWAWKEIKIGVIIWWKTWSCLSEQPHQDREVLTIASLWFVDGLGS